MPNSHRASTPRMPYGWGMPRTKIHQTLDTLHEQIRDPSAFDAAARAHLREILGEIEEALRTDQVNEHLGERVREIITAFETTHPKIATALHGIVDSLSRL